MIQFRQIQAFYAIMTCGTVTQAARQLGISQPGVSNLIANLEHYIGFKLFSRVGGRLQATPEAQRLFYASEGVIEGFDQISRRASAIRHMETGKLVIGGLPEMSQEFLPVLINRFISGKPDINVSFQTRASVKIQEMVSDHIIEVGVTEGPVNHDNLNSRLFSYPCFCVILEQHDLAGKKALTPEDLHEQPLITLGQAHMTYHRLRDIFTKRKCVWNDRCQTRLFSSALVLAREGMGIALVDPFTIVAHNLKQVVVLPFKPTLSLDLVIIWARDKPLSLIGDSFIHLLDKEMSMAQRSYRWPSFQRKIAETV